MLCRLCGQRELETLMDLGEQPIAHRLLASQQDREERFPLHIDFCPRCGLAQIRTPIDPATLYGQYNYCFSSWKAEPHLSSELEMLERHLASCDVFEVACNDGRFLAELRDRGARQCVGLEPNPFAAGQARRRGFCVYEAFLTEEACDLVLQEQGRFDMVVARQVLEHLHDIALLFRCAGRLLKSGGLLFIDLPDVVPFLQAGDCTFAWEEHVNYFTPETLDYALTLNGFEVVDRATYSYSGGTQAILARPRTVVRASPTAPRLDATLMREFLPRVLDYRRRLIEFLEAERDTGTPIVLYGVGCRACTIVNGLNVGPLIDFAVDDQPERQDKYMPGSRLAIHGTEAIRPGSLILLAVNQESESKVRHRLLATAALSDVRFLSVLGPDPLELALVTAASSASTR